MLLRIIYFIFIVSLFYQSHSYSKSTSSKKINLNSASKYFSGIVAFENKNNSKALDFFNSSKILLNTHAPYIKRYIFSLVLDNKISNAINVVKEKVDWVLEKHDAHSRTISVILLILLLICIS